MAHEVPLSLGIPHLLLEAPLYAPYALTEESAPITNKMQAQKRVRDFEGPVDCYCICCEDSSVFRSGDASGIPNAPRYFCKSFFCTRNTSHLLVFAFLAYDELILKIGQHPSLADLASVDLRRYRKALPEELYAEFNRAVGLAAHGVGIGGFVYLRRIFERLVEQAHERSGIGPFDARTPINEKIAALNGFLPDFLVQNQSLYSILSRGIHSLTEQECLDYFPIVRAGIELILDEQIARDAKEAKTQEAQETLAKLMGRLKQPLS